MEHYLNRRTTPGLSVNVVLGPDDEWVPESYMETDYSMLCDKMFEDTLHEYSTYLFQSRQRQVVSDASRRQRHVALGDPEGWRRFKLIDLFSISGTTTTPPRDLAYHPHGEHPYVTTQATNNGVGGFFSHTTEAGGVITVDSAVVGYCAYQAQAFSASDHVEKLSPKFPMSGPMAMFLATVLNMEQYRYNYGHKRAQKRLRRESVRLPCTKDGRPDWRHMERYVLGLPYSSNLDVPLAG